MNSSIQLYEFQNDTISRMNEMNEKHKGGLLISSMGTGKTLCVLKMVEKKEDNVLIICPSHLMLNWKEEILSKTNYKSEDIYFYYGSGRTIKNFKNKKFVIASYQTLRIDDITSEKLRELSIKWNYCILDEVHYMKNNKSSTFIKIMVFKEFCKYKWLLSATPIVNKVEDVKSYFMFLNIPFDKRITILKKYCIYYNKEDVLTLPKKYEHYLKIKLSEKEEITYKKLVECTNSKISSMKVLRESLDDIPMMKKMINANILVLILRLRQACNFMKIRKDGVEVSEEKSCKICYTREENVLMNCGHNLCNECFKKINEKFGLCPFCRGFIRTEKCHFRVGDGTEDEFQTHSTKLNMVCKLLKEFNKEKSIVSSQWIGTLEVLEKYLKIMKINYLMITGGYNITQKMDILSKFKKGNINVLLVSLTACCEGLNITEATKVIHIDYWWNPGKTNQLTDRTYRIGQNKEVHVYYIHTLGTIDKCLNIMNDNKRNIVNKYVERLRIKGSSRESSLVGENVGSATVGVGSLSERIRGFSGEVVGEVGEVVGEDLVEELSNLKLDCGDEDNDDERIEQKEFEWFGDYSE